MKKYKLVIFMPSIEGGGVEKNLFIISNFLAKNIKDVTLITANDEYKKKFVNNIVVVSPNSKKYRSHGRKKKYFICLLILFKMILRKEKVSVFAFQANMYAIILCKLFGVKIITRSNSSPSGWSKNILKNYIFKKVLKLADVVIVNSNEFKYEMRKKFNINTNCIYNPLNKNEIVKLSKESLKFKFFDVKKNIIKIINIGRFVDQKDQITILKALNSIKEKINFRAIIMGKGEQKKLFMNFIKSNNLKNKIKIINYQKNPYKYIRKSNLFILSSIFEGLPNVLLESMVLKKLILSTKCPTGPKEILENGKYGLFFKIRDHENLAKMIIYSYRNYNKLLSKVNSGYLSINRFDKKNNLNKYLKVVKKVLNV